MRAQSLIAFGGLLLLTAAAPAAIAAPQPRPSAPLAKAEPGIQFADAGAANANQVSAETSSMNTAAPADKKVCRRIESTVSRMAKKVCLTKQEWDQIDRDAY
jgi:hypothetical protein